MRRIGGAARPGRGAARALPAALALVVAAAPLLANGGTLRVAGASVGAYRVSVYTDPTPPRPDSLDVSVLVLRPGAAEPVGDLDVVVEARLTDPGAVPGAPEDGARVVRATRDQADDPRYHAAKFAPGVAGEWLVEVTVRGPEGGGTVAFRLEVREPGLLHRPWVVVALALLPLALLTWWLTREPEEAGGG